MSYVWKDWWIGTSQNKIKINIFPTFLIRNLATSAPSTGLWGLDSFSSDLWPWRSFSIEMDASAESLIHPVVILLYILMRLRADRDRSTEAVDTGIVTTNHEWA